MQTSTVKLNPRMKVHDLNRLAREKGCRIRLIKACQYMNCAFEAVDSGNHDAALEHIRAASAQLDEVMPCVE